MKRRSYASIVLTMMRAKEQRHIHWKGLPLKILSPFTHRRVYLAWALVSAGALIAACYIDPYAFGFTAIGAAWLTGGMLLAALIAAPRRLLWALLSAVPTLWAFALLSTYDWA